MAHFVGVQALGAAAATFSPNHLQESLEEPVLAGIRPYETA